MRGQKITVRLSDIGAKNNTIVIVLAITIFCKTNYCLGNKTHCFFDPDPDNERIQNVEAHAVLMDCTKDQHVGDTKSNVSKHSFDNRISDLFHFSGFSKNDSIFKSDLEECVHKLELIVKIKNLGESESSDELILIEEVTDPVTCAKLPLLYPYALKLQQEQILQTYPIKYINAVNGEPTEEVISNKSPGFKGCDDGTINPTCGLDYYQGNPIPNSQGFCCVCGSSSDTEPTKNDSERMQYQKLMLQYWNTKQQKINEAINKASSPVMGQSLYTGKNLNKIKLEEKLSKKDFLINKNVRETAFADDRQRKSRVSGIFRKPHHKLFVPLTNETSNMERHSNISMGTVEKLSAFFGADNNITRSKKRYKRQFSTLRDCETVDLSDKSPHSWESAHCLRFSDVWYGVYGIKKPVLDHLIHIQVFGRKVLDDGTWHWQPLTKQSLLTGTHNHHVQDSAAGLSIRYTTLTAKFDFCLDHEKKCILLPQYDHQFLHPEIRGGPPEFLVIDKDSINTDGDKCDKIGASYAAFSNQPNRCLQPRGSCLLNQPLNFWRLDTKARLEGRRGKYFLENWGFLAKHPVVKKGNDYFVALQYRGEHSSILRLQVRADLNSELKYGWSARITHVRVDATQKDATRVTVLVTNLGMAASSYSMRMLPCGAWNAVHGPMKNLQPAQSSSYELELPGQPSKERLLCNIEVMNRRKDIVATRKVRVQRNDRCSCAWQCLCVCVLSSSAGAQECGPDLDESDYYVTSMDSVRDCLLLCTFILLFILLLLGLIKFLLGLCCCTCVGAWGLDAMTDRPKHLDQYMERHLARFEVVYDEEGYPIHPRTSKRTVRMHNRFKELCMNLVFFLVWPVAVCYRNCCRPPPTHGCDCEDWVHTITLGDNIRKGIASRAVQMEEDLYYDDDKEEEDTIFVQKQLQRSLQSMDNDK